MSCPLERQIDAALTAAHVRFVREGEGETRNLDFYLPDFDLYIEVKRFHSERISGQMSRAPNVICIQGAESAKFLASLLRGRRVDRLEQPAVTGLPPLPAARRA